MWRTRAILLGLAAFLWIAPAHSQTRLPAGEAVDRQIGPDEVHTYRLPVLLNQFVHISATQLGCDIAIRLLQPDGTRYTEVDRLPYEGVEDLPWIATATGEAIVEIRARPRSKAGSYRVQAAARAPTDKDRSFVAAFVASWIEAQALRDKQNAAASREAAAKYEYAAAEARKAGEPRWEAYALSEWAAVFYGFGDYPKARDLLEQSLPLRRAAGERYSLSVSLNGLAGMLSGIGDLVRAMELFQEALAIRRQAGDRAGEAVILNNLGSLYKRLSEYDKATESLNQSLKLRREVGDRAGEAATLNSLGSIRYAAGDLQDALGMHIAAFKLYSELGRKQNQANSSLMIGNTYYVIGNSAQAQQHWKQAETIFRETGSQSGLASVAYGLGMDAARRWDHAGAVKHLDQALLLHRGLSLNVAVINDLTGLCRSLFAVDEPDKAQASGSEALALSRKIGYKVGEGSSLQCLGRVEAARGNEQIARTHLSEAVKIFEASSSRENLSNTLADLAKVERGLGNLLDAVAASERAAALGEVERVNVGDPNLRASYGASRAGRVDFHTGLLMELHKKEPAAGYHIRAFNTAEQWRARSLTEMIRERRDDLRQELTEAQRSTEDRLLAAISRVQRELFQEDVAAARQRQLKLDLTTAERDLTLFHAELRRTGSRYAAGEAAEVLDADAVRARLLDADSALIEYALGESKSYAWALTRNGVTSAELPARKEVEQQVEIYRKLLSSRVTSLTAASAIARADAEGRKLYRMLVAPIEPSLSSKKRIVVVPDGVLAYLPFEALAGELPLIERFSISYAPSASTLAALRERARSRRTPSRSLLALADPSFEANGDAAVETVSLRERGFAFTRLPNSRAEVDAIRALFPGTGTRVYAGSDASEQALKNEELESYRYVHFAAHGYFDEEQPSRSGIVLARADASSDGLLQAPEVMRLRLSADMVTLSACQTGLGKLLAGEGVMGLSRAFFYAGAQSLVVSLWSVNDAATAELMKRFYGNLKTGMARDEALRQAKLALRKTPRSPWRHPYFWAPFVFLGDPGVAVAGPVS